MSTPFQIQDRRLHRKIVAVDLVPAASAVAASVREVDGEEDGYVSSQYPGEDHHFVGEGSPSCRHDAAARSVAWLRRWVLEGEGGATKPGPAAL